MVERMPSEEAKRLAERLKLEAGEARPEFSEALHQRVCEALKHCPAPARLPAVALWLRRGWLPVAIATTLLVGLSLAALWFKGSYGPASGPGEMVAGPIEAPDTVADPGMITGPAARAVQRVGTLVDSTVTARRWAYLDHDAGVALQLLRDQLPLNLRSPRNRGVEEKGEMEKKKRGDESV